MSIDQSILLLFQLTDSFFPTGSFAHSFGLETYIQREIITDQERFESFLRAILHFGIRNCDAIAVALAHRSDTMDQIIQLDQYLSAIKQPAEMRKGSVQIGKQFLRNANKIVESKLAMDYHSAIRSGKCSGHHSVAYGVITAGIELYLVLLSYLHSYVASQVSAAVRLIPLGATDGQQTIRSLQPDLLEISELVKDTNIEDLVGFTPALDIRSMQHEQLFHRLFIS
ncbi:MAG: urease accessory protein UreF [Candidatus Poribacteria bacterium]|nr:urease accessory protein UreF [Candidatus Poribacteria bacterium]